MPITPSQAQAELARRELERRKQSSGVNYVDQSTLTPEDRGAVLPKFGVRDFAETLGGVGEVGLAGATGFLSQIPAGLLGIGAAIPGGATPAEMVASTKETLTYQPRLFTGQRIAQGLSETIAPIAAAADDLMETPYPMLSAALKTAVAGVPQALPGAAAIKGLRATTPGTFVPTVNDLFSAGRVAFNEARINGGGVRPEALGRLRRGVSDFRNEAGVRIDFDPDLHPQAVRVRQRIQDAVDSGQVDFDNLMTLRELASDVAGNADRSISMRGVLLKNQIDEFVDNLRPSDVVSGDPARAAQALETARGLWRDASKARTIEQQIELAGNRAGQFSGSGYENALRTQFRQLNARIIKGQEKGWTSAEREAIARVANGGQLDNLWRGLGKLAPTGVVSGGIGAGMGFAVGGPAGAVAVPAGGAMARWLATKGTIGNVNRAMELPLTRMLERP